MTCIAYYVYIRVTIKCEAHTITGVKNNMKTAAIYCKDRIREQKPKAIETFSFEDEKELTARLKELQKGYCEGANDRPSIGRASFPHKLTGKIIKLIYAESQADFFHVAYIGMRLKTIA